MIFKFKEPSNKTKEVMSEVAKGNIDTDFESEAEAKINKITNHKFVKLTNSGNASIFLAIASTEGPIIIPDQGGWNGFKQIANYLNRDIITLKTDYGFINSDYLEDIDEGNLILTSFAGYTAEQDIKAIYDICSDKNITLIEDASAGLGDDKNILGNGKYADIIVASTGSPKIINVGNGGFISTDNPDVLEKTRILQKIVKINEITASGVCVELENIGKKLNTTINACNYLKNSLDDVIHADKRGLNVIIKDAKPKDFSWNLKKELKTDKKGFITKCPNYNRVKEKAVAIEIKNLDYNCLKKEYLDKIIEIIEKNKTEKISNQQ